MDYSPPGFSVHSIFPSKNIGVGCHFIFYGVFLTQGSNLCLLHLLHCKRILYCCATGKAQGKHRTLVSWKSAISTLSSFLFFQNTWLQRERNMYLLIGHQIFLNRTQVWVLDTTKKFLSLSSNHSKNSVCFLWFSWIQIEKGNIYIYIRKFYISVWKNLQNSNLEELKTYREYFILSVFTFESILETVVGKKETMFYCAPAYKWLIMK